MKEAILLLDMGNVVFHIDVDAFFVWLEKKSATHQPGLRNAVMAQYTTYEQGRTTTAEFLQHLRSSLHLNFLDSEFTGEWNNIWRADMPGVSGLMAEAAAVMPLYCLSNSNEMHARDMIPTRPQLKNFRKIYLSHELGMAKPDPAIYRHVCEDLGCAPERIWFFDDVAENVESARRVGMQAHLFESAGQIRRVLGLPDKKINEVEK